MEDSRIMAPLPPLAAARAPLPLPAPAPFPDPPVLPAPLSSAGSLPGPLPRHLAIIMDGNGRWARSRGWRRTRGHREGAESVRRVTRECARLSLEALTLYAFSSENWRRPRTEVAFLMRLLERYLIQERREIMDNNIRLKAIGEIDELPARVRRE